jgi:NitT/TauT family transport system substrate-binding protein
MRSRLVGSIVSVLALAFAACGGAAGAPPASASPGAARAPESIVIAYQPGIGYAPLLIMQQQHMIEADFPNTKVQFKLLSNGDIIRDGIIAGQIQIGSGGVGPFLVGWAKGVDYQLVASMNKMDLWLNVKDPNIKSVKDLKPGMKVASPAIDSIQAIAFRKQVENELGDARKLDSNLVAMSHPDGVQNLFSGAIQAHFTSPPFQFQEVDRGAHTILRSYDAMGVSTFNSVFTSKKFYNDYPQFTEKFYGYILKADKMIKDDPLGAAKLVAAADGKPDLADQYKDWMTRTGITYDTVPAGFLKYAAFMKKIGFIDKTPASTKELELPFLQKVGGD